VLCGVIILLVVVTEWQRMHYNDYKVQRESIVSSQPGKTEVTQEQVNEFESGFLAKDEDVVKFIEIVGKPRDSFEKFDLNFISEIPEGKKSPQYLPVEFHMAGSYENLEGYLQALFNAPYVIGVKNLELVSDDGFQYMVTSRLTAQLYVSESYKEK
jgi:hypothetical protein